jgi:site-specific DNA recombinase
MLKGYAAQTELSQIKERTARGRRARVETFGRLRPSSRGPLYGYAFEDDDQPDPGKKRPAPKVRYVINEAQAAVVRLIFRRSLAGVSMRRIAIDLNLAGVAGPSGIGWSKEMIKKLLSDTGYYGEAYASRTRVINVREGGRIVKRRVQCPPEEWLRYPEGVVPAIIDQATFEGARRRREANKRYSARNNGNPEAFLLRGGYLRCGACGDRMYARQAAPLRYQRSSYWCSSKKHEEGRGGRTNITAETLDTEVWARVVDLLDNPETLGREIERMRREDPTENDLAAVESQLLQTNRAVENLVKGMAAVSTDAARAVLAQQLDTATAHLDRLHAERRGVLERHQGWLEAQRHAGEVQSWLRELRGAAESMPYDLKRKALLALDIQVTLYRADRAPRWEMTGSLPIVDTQIDWRSPGRRRRGR